MGVKQDLSRFRDIVKGKVKSNLRKYISQGEIVGKQEDEMVKIPIPRIDIPNFRFGNSDQQSVGQGQGEKGDVQNGNQPGDGEGAAGENPGEHEFSMDLSISELADILGESLALPNIQPKQSGSATTEKKKYNSLAPTGPSGLKQFKSTYKKALKRSIGSGVYNPQDPMIIPQKKDFQYRYPKSVPKPETRAVVFYLMDVSGSMGQEEKSIVQTEVFWINTWLKKFYKGLETKFIVHDASAQEVTEQEFFTINAQGGTLISSAYKKCLEIMKDKYPTEEYNIYVFHFSDGDNWSGDDTRVCINLIEKEILPKVNSFNYGQIHSKHGSGQFGKDLEHSSLRYNDKMIVSHIKDRNEILDSIKTFLGKGK